MAFGRIYRLTIGETNATDKTSNLKESVVIDQHHIEFDVTKTSDSKNNTAEIRVFNLSDDTRSKFEKKDVLVSLEVGYEDENDGNTVLIFRGDKARVVTRKQGTDIVTTINAADGYVILREGRVNRTLAKGVTLKQVVEEIVKDGMSNIRSLNYSDKIPAKVFNSGFSLVGSARKNLDFVCEGHRLEWHILNNDVLYVYPKKGTSTTEQVAVLLSPDTGLIDSPESTNQEIKDLKKDLKVEEDPGIRLRSVLNPKIEIGGYIKVQGTKGLDGLYKVVRLTHRGSYEGNEWITEVEGVVVGEAKQDEYTTGDSF